MTSEDIYRAALIELADEGNEKAKFALGMGSRVSENSREIRPNVSTALQKASGELTRALRLNGDEWTKETDRAVSAAHAYLMEAMSQLAR